MLQKYVVESQDGNLRVIKTNKTPRNAIAVLPDDEKIEWMQIELVDDGSGNLIPTLTVNQPLKDQIIQQSLDERLARESARAQDAANLNQAADALKNYDPQNIASLDDIRNALSDIVMYLRRRNKF